MLQIQKTNYIIEYIQNNKSTVFVSYLFQKETKLGTQLYDYIIRL